MFNKETYIQRRNRLKKEIGKGILLFPDFVTQKMFIL